MFIEPFLKYTWKRPNRLINILNWFCNRDQNQFNMKKNAIFISKTLGRLLNKCFTYSLLPLSPTQQYLKDFFHHYGISDRPVRTERKKKQNALSFWWPPPSPCCWRYRQNHIFLMTSMFFDKTSQIPDTSEFPSTERLRVPGGRYLVPFLVFDQCAHHVFNLFSGSCRESPRHQNRDRIARNVGKSLSEEGDEPELVLLKSRRWFSRTCSREPPLFLC